MIKICNECNKELIPEENWCPSRMKRKEYICQTCHAKKVREHRLKNKKHFLEQSRKSCRKWRQNLRKEIFDILGNECSNSNCPIPREKLDKRTLQIDHVKSNGHQQRKEHKSQASLYPQILKDLRNGSKDYQLLCVYCNWVKRYELKEFG